MLLPYIYFVCVSVRVFSPFGFSRLVNSCHLFSPLRHILENLVVKSFNGVGFDDGA